MILSASGIKKYVRAAGFVYLSDNSITIYDYLHLQMPLTVESKSLLPIVLDPNKKVRNIINNVYGHWSRSVKTADGYKLIVYNVKGIFTTQLFDFKKDFWEMHIHANEKNYSAKVQELRVILKKEMTTADDDLNIELPDCGRKPNQKSYGS